MGNHTYVESQKGRNWRFEPEKLLNELRHELGYTYFSGVLRFEYDPEVAWVQAFVRGCPSVVFEFGFSAGRSQISFPYSRFASWGSWARLLTIHWIADKHNLEIWDEYDGGEEREVGNPEKYATYERYTKLDMERIPNWILKQLMRFMYWLNIPRGAR